MNYKRRVVIIITLNHISLSACLTTLFDWCLSFNLLSDCFVCLSETTHFFQFFVQFVGLGFLDYNLLFYLVLVSNILLNFDTSCLWILILILFDKIIDHLFNSKNILARRLGCSILHKWSKCWISLIEVGEFQLWVLNGKLKRSKDDSGSGWDVNFETVWSIVLLLSLVHLKPGIVTAIQSLQTAKFSWISFVKDHVWRAPECSNKIVFVGVASMEVEDVNEFSSFEDNQFIFLLH